MRHVVSGLIVFALLCAVFRPSVLTGIVQSSGDKWAEELDLDAKTTPTVPARVSAGVPLGPVELARANDERWEWCGEALPADNDGGALNQLGCDGWTRTDGSLLLTVIGAQRMSGWVANQAAPIVLDQSPSVVQAAEGGSMLGWLWTAVRFLFLLAVAAGILSFVWRKARGMRRQGPGVGQTSYQTKDGLRVVYPTVEASGTSALQAAECPDPPADVEDASDFPTPV